MALLSTTALWRSEYVTVNINRSVFPISLLEPLGVRTVVHQVYVSGYHDCLVHDRMYVTQVIRVTRGLLDY